MNVNVTAGEEGTVAVHCKRMVGQRPQSWTGRLHELAAAGPDPSLAAGILLVGPFGGVAEEDSWAKLWAPSLPPPLVPARNPPK